jgi:hypothetical protein
VVMVGPRARRDWYHSRHFMEHSVNFRENSVNSRERGQERFAGKILGPTPFPESRFSPPPPEVELEERSISCTSSSFLFHF